MKVYQLIYTKKSRNIESVDGIFKTKEEALEEKKFLEECLNLACLLGKEEKTFKYEIVEIDDSELSPFVKAYYLDKAEIKLVMKEELKNDKLRINARS